MTRLSIPCLCAAAFCAFPASAFDQANYKKTVGETIMAIEMGDVDADALIAKQAHLIEIGSAGIRDYTAAHPDAEKLLGFVVEQAPAMSGMTLEQIEAEWHEGGALASIGVDVNELDHFGPELSLMDSVVHPATAMIALRSYKADGDENHLDQVIDELSEVVEHLDHIE